MPVEFLKALTRERSLAATEIEHDMFFILLYFGRKNESRNKEGEIQPFSQYSHSKRPKTACVVF